MQVAGAADKALETIDTDTFGDQISATLAGRRSVECPNLDCREVSANFLLLESFVP